MRAFTDEENEMIEEERAERAISEAVAAERERIMTEVVGPLVEALEAVHARRIVWPAEIEAKVVAALATAREQMGKP